MDKKLIFFLLIGLVVIANACTASPVPQATIQQETGSLTPTNPAAAYPYPAGEYPSPIVVAPANPTSAYPNPQAYPQAQAEPALMATSGPVPLPASDTGIVTGFLLLNGQPISDYSVYLADLLKDEQGNNAIGSYDRASSPRAFTDAEGRFVFANIQAKEYGLILDIVVNSYLLSYPNGKGPIFFTVQPGKVLDLGKLDYSDLPLPK